MDTIVVYYEKLALNSRFWAKLHDEKEAGPTDDSQRWGRPRAWAQRLAPPSHSWLQQEDCHTAVKGEECYDHVIWAMTTGVKEHPENYGHLTAKSSFEEFQEAIRSAHPACPKPFQSENSRVESAVASAWSSDC